MQVIDFHQPILSIDSASATLSIALRANGQMERFQMSGNQRQSSLLLPHLQELWQKAAITPQHLAAIVYNAGPGMFTGLRIGLGVAQGLALPFATPLIGVPALDALAQKARRHHQQAIFAALDARMNEVFYAFFDAEGRSLSPAQVAKPDNISCPQGFLPQDFMGVGNAFNLYPTIAGIDGNHMMADAADLIDSAINYPACAAETADLMYVRDKVALTTTEQQQLKSC